MPTCLKCNSPFPNWAQIEGKQRCLCNRKFCLGCSPWGKHNTKSLVKTASSERHCPRCDKNLPRSEFYNRRGVQGASVYCKRCTNLQTVERTRKLKLEAIAYKGGKCMVCGYNKYAGALHFHHREPNEKDFNISSRRTASLDSIKAELDKCVLACSRCHDEIEGGIVPCP